MLRSSRELTVEEQRRLAQEGGAKVLVELGMHDEIGLPRCGLSARSATDWRSSSTKRLRSRIAQHPPHLLFEHLGIVERAARGASEQLLVGNDCSRERTTGETQDRCRSRRWRHWCARAGGALDPKQKVEADEQALERGLNALLEPALLSPASKERRAASATSSPVAGRR